MAVLGRLLIASAERVDLPDLLSIDSFVAGDFKFLLKGLIGDGKPLILKGFDVINPGDAIGSQSISVRVADSVVLYPGSNAGPFFHGLPEGNASAQPLIPELRKNATNYVYLTFSTFDTSKDTRAFWDPDLDGGAGGEFTQDINTESVLKADINVSTSSFPDNTIPVCKVVVGPAVIESIEDARDMMFRLGGGGLVPDPFNRFTFPADPSASYKRAEPPTKMSSALDPNPFQGADKNFHNLKDWMDVVMTKLAELGGTTFWYEDAGSYNLVNLFLDGLGSTYKSKGQWSHSPSTPGMLTWSEDINLKLIPDNRDLIIRSGSKTLANEEVMYIPMIRDAAFNTGNVPVDWFNGVNIVNGTIGSFQNLVKGDWVKKKGDPNHHNVRVEEFYANSNLTGGVTTPALARSIKISSTYLGLTETKIGARSKGVYLSSEVLVANRGDGTLEALGGNLHWLAIRSDTIMNMSNVTTSTVTGDVTEGDGSTAKFTATAHGLVDGDYITIAGSANYDGTYKVEVESANIFYIRTTVTIDEVGVNAYIAVATTTTRSTADGLLLESANHNFADDQTIIIAGTSLAYDGSHLIKVRSATTFSFAVGSAVVMASTGTATLARVEVRSDFGLNELTQGETVGIGSPDTANILSYVGMGSLSQTHPTYNVPLSYNTLHGMENYNGTDTDNLTVRVAQLTAMMADKAQDKTIKLLPSGYQSVTNTTNGANQDIVFNANATPPQKLDVVLPGSANNGTVGLTGILSLAVNQAAYIEIDRNASFSYANLSTVPVADIDQIAIDENVLILAVRLGTAEVWLWDGFYVSSGGPVPVPGYLEEIVNQNRTLKMVRGGIWSWDLINGELTSSADAYIQVPSLTESRNTILAQTIPLPADGDVAYVDINRSAGGASNLTVNVSTISSLALSADRVIIARRIGNNVEVGTGTMSLVHGDTKALDHDDKTIRVRVADLVNSVLPSGASVTVDGVSLANGDKVLFTNNALNGVYAVDGIGVSATWTKLDAFAGNSIPQEGVLVSVQDGIADFNTAWSYFGGSWQQLDHSYLVKEPTGFPNRTDSTLSFVDLTRTFSITPVGTSFDVYQKGKPYRFTSTQSIVIPNTEGLHYIYFNNGALASTQVFTIDIIKEYAFVATVQWDQSNQVHIMLGEERHGLVMDGETHSYLHTSVGTRYLSGLSAGNFTIVGTGSSNADAELSISDGVVRDEDISISISDDPAPSLPFQQILDPIAEIPVYYRSGASGDWRKDTATTFPLKQGTARIKYNNPAGPWTTPDATSDGNYVAMWIFATNNQEAPIVAVLGQREDTTLNDAQANNTYENLSFGVMPSAEMKVIYRLIFKTDSAYANTPKAALVDVRDLRRAIDTALGAYAPSDHGLLTGLTDQDHPDYSIYVNDPAAYVGGLKQILPTDNDDVQKALNSLERFFAQMRMRPHSSDPNRVVMSGADQALTNNITLTQTIKNLMVSFDGAQIDFSTGSVYKADGITPLGINFTPATITATQYHWYSVTAIASTVNADNTIGLQLVVLSATGDGTTPTLAPKAAYAKGMQIGQIYVQESGGGIATIAAANIRQLGTGGSGSGSGDGDANELLERLKDRLINAPFEWAEPNIFLTDEDDKIFSATAAFDVANTLYKFTGVGQNIVSIQSLDSEFLTEEKDVDSVELLAFWNPGAIDSNATYEVSRNGGTDWFPVTMERVGLTTETFRGILSFADDVAWSVISEWALANATAYRELNATTLQSIGQKWVVASDVESVVQRDILYINKVGSPVGNVLVQLVKDNAGVPSTNLLDVVAQTQVSAASLAAGDNAVTLTWGTNVFQAGTYHYVITTDAAYKAGFSAGVNSVRARVDASAPIGPFGLNEWNGTTWTPNAAQTLIYRLEGRNLDLRVRITSSASNVELKGYGILYGRQEQVVTGLLNREVQSFDGTVNNYNTFTLANFLPDPDLLRVYHVETGQVYLYGTGGFSLNGYQVIFPANTFNGLGTVTLVFDQLEGTSFDNSDRNAALMAANFLGSTDASIDRSQNGRGIFLRRPDGTLREITIDNSDNIVVYSV